MSTKYSAQTNSSLSTDLGRLLLQLGKTIAVAESCTGGLLGGAISATAGSSGYFRGGVIAYENSVKEQLLGVPGTTLETYGAVSSETVSAMAQGVAALLHTSCAASVSGIAGPGGGSPEKPVGLVYIGVCCNATTTSFRHLFSGDRTTVRNAAVTCALKHCIAALAGKNVV